MVGCITNLMDMSFSNPGDGEAWCAAVLGVTELNMAE